MKRLGKSKHDSERFTSEGDEQKFFLCPDKGARHFDEKCDKSDTGARHFQERNTMNRKNEHITNDVRMLAFVHYALRAIPKPEAGGPNTNA